jgi:hypothetical protein
MKRQVLKMYALLIAALAVAGFFVNDGHLFGIMNADTALDWLRLILALGLLAIAFRRSDEGAVRTGLITVGVLYVGMGLLGLVDPQLMGLLPNGLTGFDVAFHLITGVVALAVAVKGYDHAPARG